MGKVSQEVAFANLIKHIKECGGAFSDWYCGITHDPQKRLFVQHNVAKNGSWIFNECNGDTSARAVEAALLRKGCDGGKGGGGTTSRFVYAYRKTQNTKQ